MNRRGAIGSGCVGQWRNAFSGKQNIISKITAVEALVREMQDPANPKSAALVNVIKAYEARTNARGAARAAPRTRQAAAEDLVKKANEAYDKARADADKDPLMVNLQSRLNAILQDMGTKGFTNPLGIHTLPEGKYGSLLVRHGTDALNATYMGRTWQNTNYLTHAHHIVMRHGPKNADAEAAAAVAESHTILGVFGIDLDSKENLVWAPNRGHSVDYAKNVRTVLKTTVDDANNPVVTRGRFIEILAGLGDQFIKGRII